MPTIPECIFTISEVTYLSLQNSDFFTALHLESSGFSLINTYEYTNDFVSVHIYRFKFIE